MCKTFELSKLILAFVVVLPYVWTISVKKRPRDVVVSEGGTAEISCDIDRRDTGSQVIGWLHENSGHFITYGRQILPSLDADKRSRYSVTGREVDDIYTLRIQDAKGVDNGTYKCGYYSTGGSFIPLVRAIITVRQIRNSITSPQCRVVSVENSNFGSLGVGDTVDFICSWTDPLVTRAFWASDGKLLNTRKETNYVWTRKQLTANDNGHNFTCTLMTSSQNDVPHTCSVSPLRVSPTVTILPSSVTANVGDSVEFTCLGTGIPQITSYKWVSQSGVAERLLQGYHESDQQRLQMPGENILRIVNIRQEDDGVIVACQVQIPSGMSAVATATLRVHMITPTKLPTTVTLPYTSHLSKISNVDTRESPLALSTINLADTLTAITDKSTDMTHRNTLSTSASFTTPVSQAVHSTNTRVVGGAALLTFNTSITIALVAGGMVLLILIVLIIIISIVKCTRNNRKHRKLQNGQLPLHVVNDTYGQLMNTTTTLPADEKTYEEVTTVVTLRMSPTSSDQTPLNNQKAKKTCPIYATPNKLKRNSSPTPSKVQYINMPSDVLSIYDIPKNSKQNNLPRPLTPPPPPPPLPPPKYEDVTHSPRRHRPLGPAMSCSTFSRSTYSSLASEDEFCESPDVINAIRAAHLAAFKEEMEECQESINNSCTTDRARHGRYEDIEDEYVQLQLPSPQSLNVEGLQYAQLDLKENAGGEIRPQQNPTQYAHIASTPL